MDIFQGLPLVLILLGAVVAPIYLTLCLAQLAKAKAGYWNERTRLLRRCDKEKKKSREGGE